MRISRADAVLVTLILGAGVLAYGGVVSRDCFSDDEADYAQAAKRGFLANYVDAGAIPLFTFLRMGAGRGLESRNRHELSMFIRRSGDVSFYRHYHGPLYFYALALARPGVGGTEYSARWISMLFLLVAIAATYGGCLALLPGSGRLAGCLASVLLLCSVVNVETAASVTPHAAYVPAALIALLVMARLHQTRDLRYWYLAVAAVAIAFTIIEYAVLLLATLLLTAALDRRALFGFLSRAQRRITALRSLGLFAGVLLILWPGGWLRLTLLRNYLFASYVAMVRGQEYGSEAWWQVWQRRLLASPVEYGIVFLAIVSAVLIVRVQQWHTPLLIYPALLFVTTLRNTSPLPTYVSSLLPPLFILWGVAVAGPAVKSYSWKSLAGGALTALALAYAVGVTLPEAKARADRTGMRTLVTYLRSHQFDASRVLIDNRLVPTVQYYFPEKPVSAYSEGAEPTAEILLRLGAGGYQAIVYAGREPLRFEEALRSEFNVSGVSVGQDVFYYRLAARL